MVSETWCILHIDDDEDDHIIVESMLCKAEGRTVSVDWAATLEEGRQKLATNHYQAVLVDYDLGVGTGTDLIREFAARDYSAPLILLTGRGSYAVDVEAMHAGATLYLTKKEINPLLLERSIRYAIERKQAELALEQSNAALREREAALRESEARLRLALDAARMVAWEYDPATRKVTLSENAEEVLELPHRHKNSDQGYGLIHPDDVERHRELVNMAIATGGSYVSVYRHAHREQVIWLEEHGRAVVDPSGKTTQLVGVVQNITERQKTEVALRRLESRWNAAIESFAEGVIIATEEEQVIYWNPAAQAMHGFTRPDEGIEPLEQTPVTFQLWTPDGNHLLELDEWPMRRIKRGETVRNLELRIRRPDQSWEKIFSYSGAMVDTAGGERLIFLTCHDLTEQRRVEGALQESQTRLHNLADAMPQLVWTAQPDGRVDYYNQRYQLYGGIAPADENRWEWGPVLHPDDLQPTIAAWSHAVETGEVYQVEHRVRMADGSYRWHLSRGIPVQDDRGQLAKWYGTATDIHDFKEIQEALRQREQRMRRLFESSFIGIVTRDAAGRVIEANAAYLEIIGYSCAEVEAGQVNVRDITPPEYHSLDRNCSEQVATQGFCRPYENEYLRKDGTRVPVLIGYSLFEGEHPEYIGIVLDLSELKRTQAELLTYAQKLKRSNEELENFAFMASHDLQEPLRKILLFGSSLRRQLEGQLSEEAEAYLDRMQNAAERMQAMIDGLLDLSRVNTRGSDFEPVHLTAIALDVVEDLEAQIVTTGGQVIVGDLPTVQAEKIFQPFIRLHGRQYEGSGIGLAICRKIVERHGGAITAASQPGVGSRFIITIAPNL